MSAAVASAIPTSPSSAPAPIVTLLGLAVGRALGTRRGCLFFFVLFFAFEGFFAFAVLVFKLHLDAMVEVRFLQHLAQLTGSNLRLQLFLFLVIIQIVLFGLIVVVRGVVFLSLD